MKKLLFVALLSAGIAHADILPNAKVTPGKPDPKLTAAVICAKGFTTTTVRNVTEATKKQVYANYNVKNHEGYCSGKEGCEVDHLISLELGGSNDVANLWPQPFDGDKNAHQKDKLENQLHALMCAGKISQADAQKAISTNWIDAYKKYVDPKAK